MSFINSQYNAAFVHTPKTGGRSIKEHFGGVGSGHVPASQLLTDQFTGVSFGFVRNPYDRLVSIFHGAVQHGGTWPRLKGRSFGSFVRHLQQEWQVEPHAWPMTHFLCDDDGDVLVDFVGRYERFEDDWRRSCERICMTHSDLPRMHKSERNNWRAYYTPELASFVEDIYKEDFSTFDYSHLNRAEETTPFLSCICPTYKRPHLLQNSVACFLNQDFPKARCELIIWDDAAQFDDQGGDNWKIISSTTRFPTLPEKFNALASKIDSRANILVLWEDDEIFSPRHLQAIANAWDWSGRHAETFFAPSRVWSTCGESTGGVHTENAAGRFHSSWAMTTELFKIIGGYPQTEALIFDQRMGQKLRQAATAVVQYEDPTNPTFVYRWGNGVYHGSQRGDAGYADLWKEIGDRPAPYVGKLTPMFDEETKQILSTLGSL